jgi:prephenate dehydrogenase
MPTLTTVGLVGLGLMGEVYARRLIAAGFSVTGFDVDATRNERLLQIGAGPAFFDTLISVPFSVTAKPLKIHTLFHIWITYSKRQSNLD